MTVQDQRKQKMSRFFIAATLPVTLQKAFAAAIDRVRTLDPQASFVPQQNLHLTLRFIGDVNVKKQAVIQRALSELVFAPEDERLVSWQRYGFFAARNGETLIARLQVTDALQTAVAMIEMKLQEIGLQPDRRRWTPHVTLARRVASERIDLSSFDLPALPPEAVPAINLYLSERTPHAMRYTVLQTLYGQGE